MALGQLPYPTKPNLNSPITRQVNANSTVQGQLNNIFSSGNPMLERAKTRAAQAANKRGLLNSSMGVQAGQEAMFNYATPIAQADASTYSKQDLTNQAAENQFATAANKYSTDSALSKQGFDNSYGLNDQLFSQQAGTGQYAGQGLIGMNLASKLAVQESSQEHDSSQASLDRDFKTELQDSQQGFTSSESELRREGAASESKLGREATVSRDALLESNTVARDALSQTNTVSRDALLESNSKARNALLESNTVARDALSESNTVAREAVNRAAIVSRDALAAAAVVTESNAKRAQETLTAAQRTADAKTAATALAAANTANTNLQGKLEAEAKTLGHENDLELAKTKSALDIGVIDAEVYANTQGSYLDAANDLMKQSAISVNEIQTSNTISGEDKTTMLADQATLLTLHLTKTKTLYEETPSWEQGWTTLDTIST